MNTARTLGRSRWRQFVESTAYALKLSLVWVELASGKVTRIPEECPDCGRRPAPPDETAVRRMAMSLDPNDNITALSDDKRWGSMAFQVGSEFAVFAGECACVGSTKGDLAERVAIAKSLMSDYMAVLTEGMNEARRQSSCRQ